MNAIVRASLSLPAPLWHVFFSRFNTSFWRDCHCQHNLVLLTSSWVDISEGPVQMTHFLSRFKPGLVLTVDRGELPPLPLVSWVTLSGWKERWQRTLGGVKAIYTLARCRKFVPGFSLPAFKADTLLLYEEVCQAIAADDKTLLRQVLPQLTLPFSLVPNPQTAIMHAS